MGAKGVNTLCTIDALNLTAYLVLPTGLPAWLMASQRLDEIIFRVTDSITFEVFDRFPTVTNSYHYYPSSQICAMIPQGTSETSNMLNHLFM